MTRLSVFFVSTLFILKFIISFVSVIKHVWSYELIPGTVRSSVIIEDVESWICRLLIWNRKWINVKANGVGKCSMQYQPISACCSIRWPQPGASTEPQKPASGPNRWNPIILYNLHIIFTKTTKNKQTNKLTKAIRIRIRIVYWWNAETTIIHQDLWLGNETSRNETSREARYRLPPGTKGFMHFSGSVLFILPAWVFVLHRSILI